MNGSSRSPVVHHHLQGDDLDLAAELFLLAQDLDEMGLHPVAVQVVQQDGGNLVVQGALPLEPGPFHVVVGHRHVLVTEDDLVGMVRRKDLLFVPFENQCAFGHNYRFFLKYFTAFSKSGCSSSSSMFRNTTGSQRSLWPILPRICPPGLTMPSMA